MGEEQSGAERQESRKGSHSTERGTDAEFCMNRAYLRSCEIPQGDGRHAGRENQYSGALATMGKRGRADTDIEGAPLSGSCIKCGHSPGLAPKPVACG